MTSPDCQSIGDTAGRLKNALPPDTPASAINVMSVGSAFDMATPVIIVLRIKAGAVTLLVGRNAGVSVYGHLNLSTRKKIRRLRSPHLLEPPLPSKQ